jgi:hypothetical protein
MPTLGDQLVRSPAFVVDLRGRNPAAFVREVEAEAAKIVGRYVPRTETLRSWDIHGSNVWLNHVFEFNRLPYVGYPGGRRCRCCCPPGKKGGDDGRRRPFAGISAERGRQEEEIRYNGCGVEGFRMFCCGFIGDLRGSRIDDVFSRAPGIFCANAEGYRGSPRNVPIPQAAGEDMFTYRLAREMKMFPYGRNVAAVVSAVMEKDRQYAPRKRRPFARVGDPRREVKMAWASVKPAAPARTCLRLACPAPACRSLPCPHKSEGLRRHRVLLRRRWVAPKSPWIFPWRITLWARSRYSTPTQGGDMLVSFLNKVWVSNVTMVQERSLGNWLLSRRRWQLAVVTGTNGSSQDPWSRFCASGEISSATTTKDMVSSVVQQLKHVSNLCLWEFVFLL